MSRSTMALVLVLRQGPLTAAQVAEATGRSVVSVRASLAAEASARRHGRAPLVVEQYGRGDGGVPVIRYSLTPEGREAVRKAGEGGKTA